MQVSLEQPDSCRRQMQHAHIAREFGLGGPASPKVQAPDAIALPPHARISSRVSAPSASPSRSATAPPCPLPPRPRRSRPPRRRPASL